MDLTLLTSFLAVAEAGSITDAADELHVSQSALSRRLQQLERELSSQLVVRGRHGVHLTEAGRVTAEFGRRLCASYDQLKGELVARAELGAGTVRIGGGATATSYLLPGSIASFQVAHPAIRFQVKEEGSQEVAADVVAGELDLGVVTMPIGVRGLAVQPLLLDEIVLVAPTRHPLAGRDVVRAKDLSGHQLVGFQAGTAIRSIIDGALRSAGVETNVVMELRSIPSMLQMVSSTGCLAFVSRVSVPHDADLCVVPVRRLSISRRLGLVSRDGFPLSPSATAFGAAFSVHVSKLAGPPSAPRRATRPSR